MARRRCDGGRKRYPGDERTALATDGVARCVVQAVGGIDLVERTSVPRAEQPPQGIEFATKADLEALASRVEALSAERKTTKRVTKEDTDNG